MTELTGGLYEFIRKTNFKPEPEPPDDFWSQVYGAISPICLSCGSPNVLVEQPFPGVYRLTDTCYECAVKGGD